MTNAAKKERNRAYYLKNRETILAKARERSSRSSKRLSVVSEPESSKELHIPALQQEPVLAEYEVAQNRCHETGFTVPADLSERAASEKAESTDGTIISPPMTSHPLEFQMTDYADVIWLIKPAEEESDSRSSAEAPEAQPGSQVPEKPEVCTQVKSNANWQFWVPFSLRLLLVLTVNLLLVFMQVEFYRKHDVLPQFAWPMAIVSEVAFLSLVCMRFENRLDWVRVGAFALFFLYFVGALFFHVLAESRSQLEATLNNPMASEKDFIEKELNSARESLKIAEKGRSWKNIEIFGEQVTRLQNLRLEKPKDQTLGFSAEGIVWIQVILLISMRALLMATESLNAIRIREKFAIFCQPGGGSL